MGAVVAGPLVEPDAGDVAGHGRLELDTQLLGEVLVAEAIAGVAVLLKSV